MRNRLYAVLALFAAACGEPTGINNHSAIPLNANQLVFERDSAGNYGIYRTSLDSTPINLSSGTSTDQSPALSRDRTLIAFASSRAGSSDIYVMRVDGTAVWRVTNDAGYEGKPSWSPDGKRLVFVANNAKQYWDLDIVDLSSGVVTPLWQETPGTSAGEVDDAPAFSPTGEEIIFNRGFDLYRANTDGTGRTLLKSAAGWGRYSPDGSRIVFTSIAFLPTGATNFDLATMASDGSDVQFLTHDANLDIDAAWAPDGRRIVFRREVTLNGPQDLFVINSDGTSMRQITASAGWDGHPSW